MGLDVLSPMHAINRAQSEQMGTSSGRGAKTFNLNSAKTDGKGRVVENKCLGYQSYFEEVLGAQIRDLREKRLLLKAKVSG